MNSPTVGLPSASRPPADRSEAEATHVWSSLYKVGGAAAAVTAVLIPIQVIVFIMWPPPLGGTATDWFKLFQESWLIGLLSLDLLLMADYILLMPIILALYVVLRRKGEALMAMGAVLFFVAISIYFASNTAFEMLSLSQQHAAATADAQKTVLLGAGQAMLATYQGTAFYVSYLLGSVAGILISAVMLRSDVFSRVAGYAGIAGNAIGLGLYLPAVGIVLGVFSGLVLWVWYILIAVGLIRLGRAAPKDERR